MPAVRLLTIDPGHFHAALVQKEMYAGVDSRVHVYAPLGSDLLAHLNRIHSFNSRSQAPTNWELEIHGGPDFLNRALAEGTGNVVILSGRNRGKIDRIKAAVEAGLNVLADKPWVLVPEDLPKLHAALDTADARGLIAYDIMTERFEITSILQRVLVNDPDIFGKPLPGTEEEPGVFMESVHYLSKTVAGVPLRRPAWFFDSTQQGEGLTDVGTHLVDLVNWVLFPDQGIQPGTETEIVSARRWPTIMTKSQFHKVTGEETFPEYLTPFIQNDRLHYFCNTLVSYTVRGVHVKLNVLWDYESIAGGDTHFAVFRGTQARVEVRQGFEQHFRPELYVIADSPAVLAAVRKRIDLLQTTYPGVGVECHGQEAQIIIPDSYRTGHEAHFGEVTRQFLSYLEQPARLPAWEKPCMLAKYHLTTQGVRRAQESPPQ